MKVYPIFYNTTNICMFCKDKDKKLYELPLSYFYGYKYCKDCQYLARKNMMEWIRQNKKLSWLFILKLANREVNILEETFRVSRSNGVIENGWFLNVNGWIKLSQRYNDYLLPVVKHDIHKRVMFKNIELKNFCELNNGFNYDYIKNKIHNLIS